MATEKESTERSRIVLENMDQSDEKEIIDLLTTNGVKRESIQCDR